jgi:hypothetical protein
VISATSSVAKVGISSMSWRASTVSENDSLSRTRPRRGSSSKKRVNAATAAPATACSSVSPATAATAAAIAARASPATCVWTARSSASRPSNDS